MKNKKIVNFIAVTLTIIASITATYAVNIGTVTVGGPDNQSKNIEWDGTYPIGDLETNVTNIKVKAKVEPNLNMSISASEIDLGTLTPGVESSGSLDIEVGSNAKNGIVVTVKSNSGALINTTDGTTPLTATYKYSSENRNIGSDADSTKPSFSVTNTLTETNVDKAVHTIYESNKAENNDDTVKDLKFNVSVTSSSEAEAGEYEDMLTFTITGRF